MRAIVAAAALLVAVGHADAAAAAPDRLGSAGAAAAQPSQAPVARALASRVVRARTPAARQRALLAVFRRVHLGVYTRRGKPVARGAERGPRDIYLYDFEVKTLADGLGRRETWSADDLGAALARAGIRRGGRPLSGDAVRRVLEAGVRRAVRSPRRARSLVPLLVRELGLRGAAGYDLKRGVATSRLRLDALQVALAVADATVPRAHRKAAALRRIPSATAVCGTFNGLPVVPVFGGFSFQSTGSGTLVLGQLISATHGILIGMVGVEVAKLAARPLEETHYGPAGHSEHAGEELRFQVRVVSHTVIGGPIPCGALIGFAAPVGPMANVPIAWNTTLVDRLEKYGRVTMSPSFGPGLGRTDAGGIATLVFRPKDELVPGLGRDASARGTVQARARFQPIHGPLQIAYDLAGTIGLDFDWRVRFHEQHVFDASVSGRQSTTWTLKERDMWSVPCGANSDGSGTQSLDLATPSPTRIVLFQDAGAAWQLRSASRLSPPLPFALTAAIDRSGSIDSRDATPQWECAGFRRTSAAPALAPDCGRRQAVVDGRLAFTGQALRLSGAFADPYTQCPVVGPDASRLLDATSATLPFDQVANPDVGRIAVTASATSPWDFVQTTQLPVGTSTSDDHASTSLNWSLTLDRVR